MSIHINNKNVSDICIKVGSELKKVDSAYIANNGQLSCIFSSTGDFKNGYWIMKSNSSSEQYYTLTYDSVNDCWSKSGGISIKLTKDFDNMQYKLVARAALGWGTDTTIPFGDKTKTFKDNAGQSWTITYYK